MNASRSTRSAAAMMAQRSSPAAPNASSTRCSSPRASGRRPLAASLGENLPVEAERGYNLTFVDKRAEISHPLLLADRGLAVTPLAIGLRFGGWTELGGTSLPPNPSHWKTIREIAGTVLPRLSDATASEWMGHRPSVPELGTGHFALDEVTARLLRRRPRPLRPQQLRQDRPLHHRDNRRGRGRARTRPSRSPASIDAVDPLRVAVQELCLLVLARTGDDLARRVDPAR